MLTHLSLFSGIGGFDIAAEWAGFRTVCFVEIDPFCQKVLRKHWPDVPLIEDIKDVTKEKVMAYAESWQSREQEAWDRRQDIGRGSEEEPLAWNSTSNSGEKVKDVSQRENSNTRGVCGDGSRASYGTTIVPTVDLITAGVPCQPISVAGKRRGEEDDRWLWPETIRVLSEVRPTWACFENPAGILTMGFDDLLAQMEECGYETQAFIVPACAINAPHRRDRVWIVAHNDGSRCIPREHKVCPRGNASGLCSQDVADTEGRRLAERIATEAIQLNAECRNLSTGRHIGEWWDAEPDVGRVASGVPSRVDRLRALGNAVVPQCAYPILKAIADTYIANQRGGK